MARRAAYTFGRSVQGALGLDSTTTTTTTLKKTKDTVSKLVRISICDEGHRKKDVLTADAGWGHTAFVDAKGGLHVSGRWQGFRKMAYLGAIDERYPRIARFVSRWMGDSNFSPIPVKVPEIERCERVVCGAALTAVIDEDGQIWCGGDNNMGQCGTGSSSDDGVWPPEKVRNTIGHRVTSLALGLHHGLFVTTEGRLFAWGQNGSGQLGTGNRQAYLSAREIPALQNVKKIAAGLVHSAAMTADGHVYVWGKQLHGTDVDEHLRRPEDQLEPRRLTLPEPVVDVACGIHNTAILTSSGRLFMIGRVSSTASLAEFKLNDAGIYKTDDDATKSDRSATSETKRKSSTRSVPTLSPLPGVKPLAIRHTVGGTQLIAVGATNTVLEPWEVLRRHADEEEESQISKLFNGFDGPIALTKCGEMLICEVGKAPHALDTTVDVDLVVEKVSYGWKHGVVLGTERVTADRA